MKLNRSRGFIVGVQHHWPKCEVPYVIMNEDNDNQLAIIAGAMLEIEDESCVRFIAASPNEYPEMLVISIASSGGCYSTLGPANGNAIMNLEPGCIVSIFIGSEIRKIQLLLLLDLSNPNYRIQLSLLLLLFIQLLAGPNL